MRQNGNGSKKMGASSLIALPLDTTLVNQYSPLQREEQTMNQHSNIGQGRGTDMTHARLMRILEAKETECKPGEVVAFKVYYDNETCIISAQELRGIRCIGEFDSWAKGRTFDARIYS